MPSHKKVMQLESRGKTTLAARKLTILGVRAGESRIYRSRSAKRLLPT